MWNRQIASLALAALACVTAACSPSQVTDEVFYNAAYPSYATATELGAEADLVIEGTIVSSAVKEIDIATQLSSEDADDPKLNPGGSVDPAPMPIVYTVHQVRVDRVIKGDASVGEVIEVKELGGTLGKTKYVTAEGIVLKGKATYVLFLATFDGSPASLLNPVQGAYKRDGNALVGASGNQIGVAEIAEFDQRSTSEGTG